MDLNPRPFTSWTRSWWCLGNNKRIATWLTCQISCSSNLPSFGNSSFLQERCFSTLVERSATRWHSLCITVPFCVFSSFSCYSGNCFDTVLETIRLGRADKVVLKRIITHTNTQLETLPTALKSQTSLHFYYKHTTIMHHTMLCTCIISNKFATPNQQYPQNCSLDIYEGRTESHEQQFFCKVRCFIIDKPNTPP